MKSSKDHYGKSSMMSKGKQSMTITPGTGSGSRPTGGKVKIATSDSGMPLGKERKGSVKALGK